MPGLTEIVVEYTDTERLIAEYERDLRKGRAFAHGARGVQARDLCAVTLIHSASGERCELRAEAVWVQPDGPGVGVGVQFDHTDERWLGKLEAFVQSAKLRAEVEARELAVAEAEAQDRAEQARFAQAALAAEAAETGDEPPEDDWGTDDGAAVQPEDDASEEEPRGRSGKEARRSESIFDRIRMLKPQEAQKVARQGALPERVALERSFGGAVWEGLLQNPSITGQEVAKIAKKGSLPKPVLSLIVANAAWVSIPEVQRALLGNPRLGGAGVVRVLQNLSQQELKRMSKSTAYNQIVRSAAGKLVKKI